MEIRGKTIGGLDAVRVRDALRAFLAIETTSFQDGEFRFERKKVTADFLARELLITEHEGGALLATLIADGYIDAGKLTPTYLGMALTQAEDRDRLPRAEADRILTEFLAAVSAANERTEGRILIERIHVFGSYFEGAETVGDIDLLIEAPVPADVEPEDMEEYDQVIESVKVSDYLSFHDELDVVAMGANKRVIYDRAGSS